jgi:isopenicillin-N epimerase
VDGAHAPGMLPLALEALGADFFTGNLHKWPCAPRGTAVLHVAERWRTGPSRVRPLAVSHGWGGGLAAEFDWTGTVDPTAWLAVPDALDFWDVFPEYREVQHQLVREARAVLADALGVELPHPDDASYYASMAAVPVPLAPPDGAAAWNADRARAVNQLLWEEHRIEVPFTVHEGRLLVRVSGQVYNRGEEYGRLAGALAALTARGRA